MVQLKCPECGKKFSTPTAKCPHCGSQINKDGKVMVISLVKNLFDFPDFYRNPTIEIRQKGFKHVGEVNYNEKFELAIDKECELIFKCNFVSLPFSTCVVKPGDVVYLVYDKGLNCINPIVIHKDDHFVSDTTNKNKINIKPLLAILGICALVVVLFFLDSYLKDVIRSKAKQKATLVLYDTQNSASMEMENLPQADEYEDIREQVEICETAFMNFEREKVIAIHNSKAPQKQGIMAQTLFWDANKAFDIYAEESRKLERLLRSHGFPDEAERIEEQRIIADKTYREVKRQLVR